MLAWKAVYALVCLSWWDVAGRGGSSPPLVGGVVVGELVVPDDTLQRFQLKWQPWKQFNYSVPSAIDYCPHQHCLRCSAPWEWDPHPYLPCRQIPPHARNDSGLSVADSVFLEVASSHLTFDGLLLCFTAPNVNLSAESVTIDTVTEGGSLYDTLGELVYDGSSTRMANFFTPWISERTGIRHLEPIEYGVLSDFLGNDEYYASTFQYQRYDQFRSWRYTSKIARGLVRNNKDGDNCVLLTGRDRWKSRTRYELAISLSGAGNINVSQWPVWMAPVKYDENPSIDEKTLGIAVHEAFEGSSQVGMAQLSVRGPKEGAVCPVIRSWPAKAGEVVMARQVYTSTDTSPQGTSSPAGNASLNTSTTAMPKSTPSPTSAEAQDGCRSSGRVTSPRTGECISCPRLEDLARDRRCSLLNVSDIPLWTKWTNRGWLPGKGAYDHETGECCATNSFPQLIGAQACGGTISPRHADADVSTATVQALLPARLCQRYATVRRVWEQSFCPLECLQDGNVDFRKKPFGNVAAVTLRSLPIPHTHTHTQTQTPKHTSMHACLVKNTATAGIQTHDMIVQELGRPKDREMFGSRCSCDIRLMFNASRGITDAYMAQALVSDFLHDAAVLVDEYSLARVARLARGRGLDLDKRRLESPTRRRGLGGLVVAEQLNSHTLIRRANASFEDMYNQFVDFNLPRAIAEGGISLHRELGRVDDFDSQYFSELYLGCVDVPFPESLIFVTPSLTFVDC